MAARVGRAVTLTWDGAAIDGVREKGIALAGEPIDITSDEDDGWRTLLATAGENQVTITMSGVTKSNVLRAAWFAGARTEAVVVTYPSMGSFTGNFYLASYSESDPYNDATTFDCELQSTGEVTYTPPA
ncbi:MAG: phage tail protein [Beijerinckiaceae bacterium]|nr:phage tail protein [Beijerinckiaceae bacterium]